MMKLAWFTFFVVICNAKQAIGEWRHDGVDQPVSFTPVYGKHLRLLANPLEGIFDLKRNSTGHVVQFAGPLPLALDWLSLRYNFTYSYVPIIGAHIFVDDLPNQRGGIGYFRLGEADMFISAVVGSPSRFKGADYSAPWMASPFSILIPISNSSANVGALIEPMSTEVWILIALSVPAIIASLIGLSKCINALNKRIEPKATEKNSVDSFQIIDYVICVLLSQGAYCEKKQLAIRIAAAAWCLACFVLVQAYSSTLIAFITSPNHKPIINSVYDIPNVPGLKITVTRNFAADLKLQETNFGIYKKLGDSLREDPSLRCNKTELCLNKVRSGNFVYIHGKPIVQKIITMDREQTGSCHFAVASESFMSGYLYWLLAKKSPYTETINRGILRMQETGFLGKWIETFNPEGTECLLKKSVKKNGNSRISLQNLTSAFILLIVGISVSFLVFFVEFLNVRLFGRDSSCKISHRRVAHSFPVVLRSEK